ncbi:hypothetical protein DSO57_1015552 [Entomophthora muscae]|uniref:Uncharacterized protein n=1 Tax=Entomophthora muscae TaxID=34485 RepID=A0ACC2S7J8_9FUNG|nr:hypothetical protein DSO57_1015552 [Entomophthora muscae]
MTLFWISYNTDFVLLAVISAMKNASTTAGMMKMATLPKINMEYWMKYRDLIPVKWVPDRYVIFHLNSSQIDNKAPTCTNDQPVNLILLLYCPPGAPFRPVHFTEYLTNPAYLEFNLKNLLIADPLARTRDQNYRTQRKEDQGATLIYNYLPAYFVPMTLPLTLQPNHPMKPSTSAKTTSTQLFGVLYITLTGLMNSMVPNSGPWSLLRQSLSYVIKLAPILWWALPTGSVVLHPKSPNASTYAWLYDRYQQTAQRPNHLLYLNQALEIPYI